MKPGNASYSLKHTDTYQLDGKWFITIENSGDSYARFSESLWEVSDGKESRTLTPAEVGEHIRGNLILPNSKIDLEITPFNDIEMENMNFKIEEPVS